MEYIYVGVITSLFGIKGELKVLSYFEFAEKVFIKDNYIYIDNEKHLITNVRIHKNKYLVEIDNLKDINLVDKYRGLDIYFDKKDLKLKDGEYLLEDLIDLEVINNEEVVGFVTEVINVLRNPLIKVNDKFYIPVKGDFIIKIDKNKIICKRLEELMI